MNTDWGLAAGLWTGFSMLLFVLVALWAYSRHNRERFDQAAQLAVSDELPPGVEQRNSSSSNQQQEQQA